MDELRKEIDQSQKKITKVLDKVDFEAKNDPKEIFGAKVDDFQNHLEDAGLSDEQKEALYKKLDDFIDNEILSKLDVATKDELLQMAVDLESELTELSGGIYKVERVKEVDTKLKGYSKDFELISNEMLGINKKIQGLKVIDVEKPLIEALKLSGDFFRGSSFDEAYSGALDFFVRSNEAIKDLEKELRDKSAKQVELKKEIYSLLYDKARLSGKSGDDVLLNLYNDLGRNVPDRLKPNLDSAIENRLSDSDLSGFERLCLDGKYRTALEYYVQHSLKEELTTEKSSLTAIDIAELHEYSIKPYNKKKRELKVGGFRKPFMGETLVKDGYISLVMPRKGAENHPKGLITLVKKMPDGSYSCFNVNQNGELFLEDIDALPKGAPLTSAADIFSKKDVAQAKETRDGNRKDLSALVDKLPNLNNLNKASSFLMDDFLPLQNIVAAASKGKKSKDFVGQIKKATKVVYGKSSHTLGLLRKDIQEVKRELALLKRVPQGFKDEFETKIMQMEKAYSGLLKVIESEQVEKFCENVLNPAWSEDDLEKWLSKDGVIMLFTIVTAVTATAVLAAGTGGVSLVAAWCFKKALLSSFVMTAGGLVGSEVGQMASEAYGEYLNEGLHNPRGASYSDPTLFGKYLSGGTVLDPKTGQYKKVSGANLAKSYGGNFVISWLTVFGAMKLGKVLGEKLSEFALKHKEVASLKGGLAKMLDKIPRFQTKEIELLNKEGMESFTKMLGKEYLEELGQEGIQDAMKKCSKTTGYLSSVYFAMHAKSKLKLSGIDIKQEGKPEKVGGVFTHNFSMDGNDLIVSEAAIVKSLSEQGFDVKILDDGTINAKTAHEGAGVKYVMNFKTDKVLDPESKADVLAKSESDRAQVEANLNIDDSDGGTARISGLESSLVESSLLASGQKLSDADKAVVLKMHHLGGSGKENLREKLAIAIEHGKSKSPQERKQWKKVYKHALQQGFAGTLTVSDYLNMSPDQVLLLTEQEGDSILSTEQDSSSKKVEATVKKLQENEEFKDFDEKTIREAVESSKSPEQWLRKKRGA